VARDAAGGMGGAQEGGNLLTVRRPALPALEFPGREATDVDVKVVQSGVVTVAVKLELEFQLILRDGCSAHRAERPGPRPAPGTVRSSKGYLRSADRFSGLRAQNSLVGYGSNSRSAGLVMPDARRPGRLFASPGKPDGRQLVVYIFKTGRSS
jgi:hypothetical protein